MITINLKLKYDDSDVTHTHVLTLEEVRALRDELTKLLPSDIPNYPIPQWPIQPHREFGPPYPIMCDAIGKEY